jgi:hypothetical protein
MTEALPWLIIFAVGSIVSLLWAASQLAAPKVYQHYAQKYPFRLEFNSSLAVLFSIVVTIITSIVVGHLMARYIEPGDDALPTATTTLTVILIWLAALGVAVPLVMRAKVIRVRWVDNPGNDEKTYPVTIVLAIALSTVVTLALATVSATVFAILILHVVKAF